MATSNSEWLQIYHDNLAGTSQPTALQWSGHVTDSTTLTTTTTSSSNVSNQDGRVTRPTNTSRKSTRTSRRTPTTLLNADITNFRSMVQQFTGRDSSIAFMAAPSTVTDRRQPLTSYSANYGVASRISPPTVGGYSVEEQQLPHQQYYRMAVEDGGAGGGHHHRFVQKGQEGNEAANFPGENYYGGNNTRIF